MSRVTIIGAGLAGCEAAWQLAGRGIPVTLCEMKPVRFSPAHSYAGFAELVCSNSLKAKRVESAAGLLKEEMRRLGSVVVKAAGTCEVPAGGALAVDRTKFSDEITRMIKNHPLITVVNEEITRLPEGPVIIATGPLTSEGFSEEIAALLGEEYLRFYDAASPIVTAESVDMDKAFFGVRYQDDGEDYINCPMDKEEYERFHEALITAETAPLHGFETDPGVYEGCMPIEVLAKRGADSIRFGPLKPVGLRNPKTGHRPWAAVQLRAENAQKSLYNLVGFQTNLKFGEQKRVFSMIPGLESTEFMRYGVMHRNTFINSPKLLDARFCLKKEPRVYFAGQITGVEGYCESAAAGIIAGINMAMDLLGKAPFILPTGTMIGALAGYISDETVKDFQPMGANMGLLPAPAVRIKNKKERYAHVAGTALAAFSEYTKDFVNLTEDKFLQQNRV